MYTREEARARGLKRYNGVPCKRGHMGKRYVSTAACCECGLILQRGRYQKQPRVPYPPTVGDHRACARIVKAFSFAAGLKRYFTGVPCLRGHISERNRQGGCVACFREVYFPPKGRPPKQTAAEAREVKRLYRLSHPEQGRRWRITHPEKVRAARQRQLEKPGAREKQNAYSRARRKGGEEDRKYRATCPEWSKERKRWYKAICSRQIAFLTELGYFQGVKHKEQIALLIDLKRLGVIKQEDWK